MSNQMTLTDRIAIEAGIAAGKTFKEIAAKIHRNPATISREIKANRTVIPATFYLGCDCRYARSCHKHNLCTDMECSIPCIKCRIVKCTEFCPTYKPKHCSRIEKPPYVCNKCYYRNDCDKRRYMYSAKLADALSSRRRSDTRTGIRLSPDQLKDLDELLSAQVKKGQPLTHIYAEHEAELPVSLRSLYNYIDSGQLSVRNIDLRRKTGYKPRKGKKQTSPIPDYRVGRTYEDFKKYKLLKIELHEREVNRINRMVKTAGFRVMKTLDDFVWNSSIELPHDLTREYMMELSFLQPKENLIFMGAVGTGKTHLATAIALKACQEGRRVRFFTAAELANILLEKNTKGTLNVTIQNDKNLYTCTKEILKYRIAGLRMKKV